VGSGQKDDIRVTPPPRLDRPSSGKGEPVTDVDVEKLHETINKIASAVNASAKHTEQIPDIKKKVDSTSDKVVALDTKMDGVTERVTKVENKVDKGHDCFQVDVIAELKDNHREASQKIEMDVQKGIEQRAKLEALSKEHASTEADVEDIKKAPRRMFFGLLGVIVTIVSGALGASWFLAELQKDVEFEREQRTEQFKRIETQIKAVGSKADTTTVKQTLADIEDEIEESNGHEQRYNALCDGMQRHEKRFMKTTLQKRGKTIPASCLE
jgi:hypothetical protein